jgi:hypothetical protein
LKLPDGGLNGHSGAFVCCVDLHRDAFVCAFFHNSVNVTQFLAVFCVFAGFCHAQKDPETNGCDIVFGSFPLVLTPYNNNKPILDIDNDNRVFGPLCMNGGGNAFPYISI